MADGKRITKTSLLADLAKIRAELEAQPQQRLLLKSEALLAKAALAHAEAALHELRARECALKAAQTTCEAMVAAVERKTPAKEKARGSPHPWSPAVTDDIPTVQTPPPPPPLSAEPPKEVSKPGAVIAKPAPVKALPLVHVGDECKDWTPQDWAAYYRTGRKPEPKPETTETETPKELSIAEEPEKTPLDGEVTR